MIASLISMLLIEGVICAFCIWRVVELTKRVKYLQKDRDSALKEWYKVQREKPTLTVLEKKMILASLNMPQYKAAMDDPKTKHEVRKVYRELKGRLKESIE